MFGRTVVRSILLNVGAISGMQAMDHYDRDVLVGVRPIGGAGLDPDQPDGLRFIRRLAGCIWDPSESL